MQLNNLPDFWKNKNCEKTFFYKFDEKIGSFDWVSEIDNFWILLKC